MADSWNKKEREKKKQLGKKLKEEKRQERKEQGKSGDDMMAYLDEFGNIVSSPPDPAKKIEVNAEDIVIGVPKWEEGDDQDTERTGVVTFFNSSKGYGFIKDVDTQQSLFVHINDLEEEISEQDKVTFEIGKGQKGPVALKVKRVKK
ncbi:MAG: hypothetical protein RLZ10_438 [Bacteroidota bacterium]|jgi:cold shock CspA family protein